MPTYDYKCMSCDYCCEAFRPISRRHYEAPWCGTCDRVTVLQISAPAVRPDSLGYYDEGLGQHIESHTQRTRVMKARGLQEADSTRKSGAKGTTFSFPGLAATSVPPSGAYHKEPPRA